MRPACAARRAAAASTSSSVLVGTSVSAAGRPGAWPLRPARCSSRATPLAEPICSTRSTGRKSTPRSSDEVATTALQLAFLQAELDPLAHRLVERAVVQRDQPGPLGPRLEQQLVPDLGLRARVGEDQRGAAERSISSTTGCCICAPRWPPQEKRPGSAGSSVSMTSVLSTRPCTSAASRRRAEQHAASPRRRLPSVADRPQTHEPRVPAPQPRERQLHLHAALVADQLVPLVDDDDVHAAAVPRARPRASSIRLSDSRAW